MGFFDRFRRKRESGPEGMEPKGNRPEVQPTRHCFVLCETVEPSGLDRVAKVVERVFGPGHSAEFEGAMVTISRGETTLGFLAHIPAPIPNGEAEENADKNFLWRDGREEAAKHRSHVIVTNLGGGDLSPVESALAVSRLALVALDVFDGLGVYWGNASVCNSRSIFEDFCSEMSEEHLPLPMWLRFQLVRGEKGELGLYTLGMNQFGLMDIEVERSPLPAEEMFQFVANVAHYLVTSGPVIADGNTVGGSEQERILVRHRPSMIEPDRKVYQIVFDE
jgi:hypothetical protein